MAILANILIDPSGRVRSWNERARRLWGFADEEAIGRHCSGLFTAGLDDFQALLAQMSAAGHAEFSGTCVRRDGSAVPAQTFLTAMMEGGLVGSCSMVVQSLSDQSQGRRLENDPLYGIIQSAMDAIITVDENQNVVLFNAAAERIFRCPAAAATGGPLDRFIPVRFRDAHRTHIERFGATGTTTRMMGARLALSGLRADGEEFPIDASISQVTVGGDKLYTVILRDIGERRRAEEALERSYRELRELSGVMNEVREAERTRIARELHDELAQWLTALKMDVSWLSSRLPPGQAHLVARAERMKGVVDTTVASVRRIAADLRPVMLDDLGLVPSIEHLLHTLSERANVVVSLDVRGEGVDFGEPVATGIYRMVQEALTNVARHSHATEVRVTLGAENGVLLVRVTDNGVGLGSVPSEKKSYGLLGIRERAQTLGGSAAIRSPESGGTTVEIAIPLARYVRAEAAR